MSTPGIIRAAAAILAGAMLSGCELYQFTVEEFAGIDEISLTIKGTKTFVYSPERHQIGFNPDKYEFRVSDDNMADYFFLDCDDMPVRTDQVLTGDLEYTTPDDIKSRHGLDLRVTDVRNGKIWLWNQKYRIGIVVATLPEE